jgi:hypothetical protein
VAASAREWGWINMSPQCTLEIRIPEKQFYYEKFQTSQRKY